MGQGGLVPFGKIRIVGITAIATATAEVATGPGSLDLRVANIRP
jgi:hypothetical protein